MQLELGTSGCKSETLPTVLIMRLDDKRRLSSSIRLFSMLVFITPAQSWIMMHISHEHSISSLLTCLFELSFLNCRLGFCDLGTIWMKSDYTRYANNPHWRWYCGDPLGFSWTIRSLWCIVPFLAEGTPNHNMVT